VVKVAKTTTHAAYKYGASLSRREASLLAGWERERRVSVTTADIRDLVGPGVARDVASRLVAKRVLQRVGRGKYLVRPLRTQTRPSSVSAAVQAAVLLQGEPYYLGGLWAITFHRLTEQQYVSVLDAFVGRRHSSRRLGNARILFHRLGSARLLDGVASVDLEGMQVRISDPERTVLDLVDLPVLAGGASEALALMKRTLQKLDRAKLVAHAVRGARNSTCQRLGVLLERAGMAPRRLTELHRRVTKTKSLLSMNPGAPRTGTFNRRWSVIENDR
jgi:predicted transcriptional regulator of viral defense system